MPGADRCIAAVILATLAGLWAPRLPAAEIQVAVAANFAAPMRRIAAIFTRQHGAEVALIPGSSGKLFAQIRHGAPFEVFLSADQAKPQALEQRGLAVAGSRFTYALGTLVLWSADPNAVDPDGRILATGTDDRLALANPRLAPYGAAAVEVLEALGLVQATRERWVLGENIAQTYQFVHSGNARIGFVALSQVITAGREARGSAWPVPAGLHTPIRQDAVLLQRGAEHAAARALLGFLQQAEARALMAAHGYRAPGLPEAR